MPPMQLISPATTMITIITQIINTSLSTGTWVTPLLKTTLFSSPVKNKGPISHTISHQNPGTSSVQQCWGKLLK